MNFTAIKAQISIYVAKAKAVINSQTPVTAFAYGAAAAFAATLVVSAIL